MNEKAFIKKIYKIHIKQLRNLDIPHKKLMILFSGIPGSGKTYIAKIIEKRYKGIRIRTDSIRKIIRKIGIVGEEEKEHLLKKYYTWLLLTCPFSNILMILDKGIDREYNEMLSLAKKKKYKLFLIRVKTSRKILEKRIFEKNNCRDSHFDREIDRWTREWKEFGKEVKPDILIENENKLDLEPLFLKLDKLVKN